MGSVLITQSVPKLPLPSPITFGGGNSTRVIRKGLNILSLPCTGLFKKMYELENSFGKEAGKLRKDPEWDVEGRFASRALTELKVDQENGVISANVR